MSDMTESAIQNIERLVQEGRSPQWIDDAETFIGFWQTEKSPNGVVLTREYVTLDLEGFKANPRRKKGTITVFDPASFIAYFNFHKAPESVIFADGDNIVGILNHHGEQDAGWGDHRVTLQLKLHSEWQAWIHLAGQGYMEQEDFANHLDLYQNNIASPSAGEVLDIAKALQITANASFEKMIRNGDGTVQFHYTNEHSTKTPRGTVDLKDGLALTLRIAPYEGSPEFMIEGKVMYDLRGDSLFFRLFFGDQPRVRLEQARAERRDTIAEGTGTVVLLGKVG